MKSAELEKFIKKISDRLPMKFEVLGTEKTYITGKDLKLTGQAKINGVLVDDNLVYEMEVPIVKGEIIDGDVAPKAVDHRKHLRTAWLIGGLPAMYSYLSEFMCESELQKIKNYFMSAE
jgi:hypothetical protein